MTTEGVKRKLSAILSADVKGYSRLMGRDELGTIRTLTDYREVITKLVEQYKGRVVDAPGDNLLAEFTSAMDAVISALKIQRELTDRNTELPAERIMEFRIGVNVGDIIEKGERIYGDGVNIAAGVEGLAEGGGICISGTVYDQVSTKLDLAYEYLGEKQVKNIVNPVRVYKIPIESEPVKNSDLICAIGKYSEILDIENDNKKLPVPDRIARLGVGGIPLPCFFPSISSAAKNYLTPLEHLNILSAVRHPLFLISAYDILNPDFKVRKLIKKKIAKAAEVGQIVLLDSGVYENRWSKSKERWLKKNFRQTLRETNCHLAFCYDNPNPKTEVDKIITNTTRGVLKDKKVGDFKNVLPIAHAQDPEDFPTICAELARKLNPPLVAVPERELGEGVLEVAKRVLSIRNALNNTGKYYPLHILGTGNPLSILIYVALGADSFVGLDWCQTAVDHSTGHLYHTLQFDFFIHQTQFGSAKNLPFLTRLFAHNLQFYRSWMDRIKVAIQSQLISEMINEFLPKHIAERLKQYQPNLSN